MLEHVRTLYTPRTSTSEHIECSNLCVIVAAPILDYLLVDSTEVVTRVSGKQSVSGTGSSFKGREGKTGLT